MSEEKVVYRGSHHYIVCDGKDHYRILENKFNEREHDCKCRDWFECPNRNDWEG